MTQGPSPLSTRAGVTTRCNPASNLAAVVGATILARAALETATPAAVLMVLIGLGFVAYSLHVWSRRTLARTLHRFHSLEGDAPQP